MDQKPLIDRVREAVKRDAETPAIERWNALVARGAIDAEGRVLLKAPKSMVAPLKGKARRKGKD